MSFPVKVVFFINIRALWKLHQGAEVLCNHSNVIKFRSEGFKQGRDLITHSIHYS